MSKEEVTATRKRLDPEQRREQLLDIGAKLFGERPYEDVLIEEVAELAGVSRGLMYHYFPNKRDFSAAIVQRSAEQLLAATEIDPNLPMAEQISAGLDAYIDHFVKNPHGVLAISRGSLSGDPAIQRVVDWEQEVLRDRMLGALGVPDDQREITAAALLGWIGFTRAVCTDWIQSPSISREDLRDLCVRALVGSLGPVARLDERPH